MSEGLFPFIRVGILKSMGLVIPNDMDTVESVISGDVKPCLLVQSCLHTVVFLMDLRYISDLGITAVF